MNNEALFQEALTHFPGGVSSPVRAFKSVGGTPKFFKRAWEAWFEDEDGKTYVMLVGMETPTQTGYYIQLDNGAIQVVAKFSLDTLLSLVDEPPILATPTPEVTATSPISGTQAIPGTSVP